MMAVEGISEGRLVRGEIDAGGIYCSRLAAADGLVFLSSTAVDETGRLAVEAEAEAPYALSPSARVRRQTHYIFDRYKECLGGVGASVGDLVQLEQYIERKTHCDGYMAVSRGGGYMERNRPGSCLVCTGDFLPECCVVNPTAIAIIPGSGLAKEILNTAPQGPGPRAELGGGFGEEPPYNEIVTAGPYVFTVGDWACDYETGIHPDAKAPDWIWWGSEVRNEARFILEMLATRLAAAGTSLANALHCTVHLTSIEDLYDLDLVWREYFPSDPPARTVIPVRGLGVPRREGARTHAEGAIRLETIFQSIRPGFGVEKEIVSAGSRSGGHESEAIRAGALLWISGQLAASEDGRPIGGATPRQLDYIFERIAELCSAAGTTLANLLRIRAYVTDVDDGYAVYSALKDAVPSEPPCVAVCGVPGPLPIPGCSAVVDAVAYVPRSPVDRSLRGLQA